MTPKSDQWVDAVAKLTELTQDGTLEWTAESMTENESVIGPTYRASYGDKLLRLRKRGTLARKKSWGDEEWVEQYVLEFVDQNDGWFLFFLDHARDLLVLGGDAAGNIDRKDGQVGPANTAFRAHHAEDFNRTGMSGAFAHAGSVDENKVVLALSVRDVDGVASGAGNFADNGALGLGNGVDE